ncbi:hypothetical protein DIPPA_10820 [Diplonema papillatum]|nr:hypothetical protein DIPPA_10820 [Diplonema papillatum]
MTTVRANGSWYCPRDARAESPSLLFLAAAASAAALLLLPLRERVGHLQLQPGDPLRDDPGAVQALALPVDHGQVLDARQPQESVGFSIKPAGN